MHIIDLFVQSHQDHNYKHGDRRARLLIYEPNKKYESLTGTNSCRTTFLHSILRENKTIID